MARLPTPVIETTEVAWPDDYKSRENTIYEILGQAMRERRSGEKRKEDKEDEGK